MALLQGRDSDQVASCPAQLWIAGCVEDLRSHQEWGEVVWPQQEAQASRLRVSARTLTFQFEPLVCPEFFQHSGPRASGDVSSL